MPTPKKPLQSAAKVVRESVASGGERFWKHSDFGGLQPAAVATELSRLARAGDLQRVAKGVYYHPTVTAFGTSMAGRTAVAAQTLRSPVHPAGLSAVNVLGLSTQNPGRPEYATSAMRAPTALQGAIVYTGRPQQRAKLSTVEGAILETLRERASSSDLSPEETSRRFVQLLADEQRFRRLVVAAMFEPPRVRAMLGALGEELGMQPRLLEQLRKSINPLSRFDFGKLDSLSFAREWQAK